MAAEEVQIELEPKLLRNGWVNDGWVGGRLVDVDGDLLIMCRLLSTNVDYYRLMSPIVD